MPDRHVVITGVGLINALGLDAQVYFDALLAGTSGVRTLESFDASRFPCTIGGEAPRVKLNEYVPKSHRKATKLMSRDIELAVIAANAAVRNAGLKTKGTAPEETPDFDPTRAGTNIGAGLICCDLVEMGEAAATSVTDGKFDYKKWGQQGMQSLTPLWLLKYLPNMLGCHVSIIHDLQGPNNNITSGEVSGLLSVAEAVRTIIHNRADLMVAGSAECKLNPMAFLRQCLLKRLSTHANDRPAQACRPFDREADGMVVGEGGAIIILEEEEHARKRGANIYARISGFAASSFASKDFLTPDDNGEGMALAMQKALARAGLQPKDIDLLTAHGLGLPDCDRAETQAIRTVFGDHTSKMPVMALKSRIGNCGAGASAIDLATTILALDKKIIPANLNCDDRIDEALLAPTKNLDATIENALVNSYTFGGQTAAMVISKYKG
ncbi:MAG: beta-ketoacyl-[acyl-carrier-protein] synthase family protein [Sedimentisphaerales bacterium]|nr:beta-ketoacyl-[acyl-carrier-protein] synthase family protein [Sedimentisphaerales bacterium]